MLIAAVVLLAVFSGLIGLLVRLLKAPIKWVFKLLLHALFGYISLFIFNFVGAWLGLSIDITWLSAIVAGVLGVPGVILLLVLKYLL